MGQTVIPPQRSKQIGWITTGSILLVIAIFLSGLFLPQGANWLIVMSLMIGFVALIGKLITGRWSGIFINERNKMSLSRFQLVLWTLIVLSAFLTIALERIYASATDPLAIQIPQELWALLGISTTALVGSPLILSTKVPKTPSPHATIRGASLRAAGTIAAIDAARKPSELKRLNEKNPDIFTEAKKIHPHLIAKLDANPDDKEFSEEDLKTIKDKVKESAQSSAEQEISASPFGTLDFNQKIEDANFADLFTGEEVENRGFVDMGKVQMFFFTIIIAFSYMVLLVNLIWKTSPATVTSFPAVQQSVAALLGISTAGYLGNKAPDKTQIG
jgi:hypothetical protein